MIQASSPGTLKIKLGRTLAPWKVQLGTTAGWEIWRWLPQGRNLPSEDPRELSARCLPHAGSWGSSCQGLRVHENLPSGQIPSGFQLFRFKQCFQKFKDNKRSWAPSFSPHDPKPQELLRKSKPPESGTVRNSRNLAIVLNYAYVCLTWFFLILIKTVN